MKYICFLIILLAGATSDAQSFHFNSKSPFNLKVTGLNDENGSIRMAFIDKDNDGDLDVIHFGIASIDDVDYPKESNIHYFIEYQENTGTKSSPVFGPRIKSFENFPYPNGIFLPSVADINKDKLMDIIVNGEYSPDGNPSLIYYRNKSATVDYLYDKIDATGLDLPAFPALSLLAPELTDMDKDGDFDIFVSGYILDSQEDGQIQKPIFYYAKNTGTAISPKFLGWFDNPYNLKPVGEDILFTACGDVDNDGDVDIFCTGYNQESFNLYFYENTPGSNGKPNFKNAVVSPFGLPTFKETDILYFPGLVDLDGDSDLDLFLIRDDGENLELLYYVNDLINETEEVSQLVEYRIQPNPASDIIGLQTTLSKQPLKIEICNLSGMVLSTFENNFNAMDIKGLEDGLYLVKIFEGNKVMQLKLVILKD